MVDNLDWTIWRMVKKDFVRLGIIYDPDDFFNLRLRSEEVVKAYGRGGFKLGYHVHRAFVRDGYAMTFDDITGVPFQALSSRQDADISTKIGHIELCTPLISANMASVTGVEMAKVMASMGGVGIIHQFAPLETRLEWISEVKSASVDEVEIEGRKYSPSLDKDGRYLVGAALGVNSGRVDEAMALAEAGADLVMLDMAHGYAEKMISLVSSIKDRQKDMGPTLVASCPTEDELEQDQTGTFIAGVGNVVSAKGAYNLCEAGADVIKVGVGPGASCTTRVITGFGVPQITALYFCSLVAKNFGASVIADGGIRNTGDIIKALAAGADGVMLGRLLAGTDQSEDIDNRIIRYKGADPSRINEVKGVMYHGSASEKSKRDQGRAVYDTPEGRSVQVPYSGDAEILLAKFITGLQSGMSYAGSGGTSGRPADILRLQQHSRWMMQSTTGQMEAGKGNMYMT